MSRAYGHRVYRDQRNLLAVATGIFVDWKQAKGRCISGLGNTHAQTVVPRDEIKERFPPKLIKYVNITLNKADQECLLLRVYRFSQFLDPSQNPRPQ